jgi:hypothetical protein
MVTPWLLRGAWDNESTTNSGGVEGGIGSWSPDLAVSPTLLSSVSSNGVAMGDEGGWATGKKNKMALGTREEETEHLVQALRGAF